MRSLWSLIRQWTDAVLGLRTAGKPLAAAGLWKAKLCATYCDILLVILLCGASFQSLFAQQPKPPSPPDVPALVRTAQEALGRANYAAAVKALKAVVEAQPDYTGAWFNLGYAYSGLHQDAEAVEAYRKALGLAPNLFEARLNLGILLLEMKEPQAALEHLEKAVALKPDHPRAHLYYGRGLSLAGQPEAAQKQFQEALRLDPQMAIAHFDLGQLHLRLKRYSEALPEFQKAVELDSTLAQAQLGWALASEGLKDLGQAITHFEQYLAAQPDDLETRFHLARVYLQQGSNEKALECLQAVYRARPSTDGLAAALGDVYALLKKFPESEKFYREALAASPGEPDLHRALGRSLLDQEKFAAAEAEFRTALKLDPHYLEAAKGLATSLYLQKRYPEAIPVLEAVASTPDAPAILFFMLASCYDHLRERANALKEYEHFLALSHGLNPTQEWQAEQRAKLLRRELQK
jgi:tetratricopeptide (TPR) repeat protein